MIAIDSIRSQVERIRLSRSKKTGGSKGYAFVEFKDVADAKVVSECMVRTSNSCYILDLEIELTFLHRTSTFYPANNSS
jgi:RNA recognition motif-containing protein